MVRPSLDRVLKCGEKACTSSLSSTGFSQQGINWRPKTSCNGERSQEIHSGIATAKNTVEHLPHDVNSLTASLRRWIYDVRYQRYVIHIVHITDNATPWMSILCGKFRSMTKHNWVYFYLDILYSFRFPLASFPILRRIASQPSQLVPCWSVTDKVLSSRP